MDINPIKARDFSETCEHQKMNMCSKRNKLRDCYRPLCCGICPKIDTCEGVCIPIKEDHK